MAWTLRSWGAWSLKREIVEVGKREDPHWRAESDALKYHRVYREHGHYGMKYPELIVDKTSGSEFLIDLVSEEPLVLFDRTVLIDKRLKAQAEKARRRSRRRPRGRKFRLVNSDIV